MILFGFTCTGCDRSFRLVPSDNETEDKSVLDVVFEHMRGGCPYCHHDIKPQVSERNIEVRDVTPGEFWRMMNGQGDPDEVVTSTEQVANAMRNRTITGFALGVTETGRCTVTSILLDSGKELHFAVGYGQAVIYKITNTIKEQEKCPEE